MAETAKGALCHTNISEVVQYSIVHISYNIKCFDRGALCAILVVMKAFDGISQTCKKVHFSRSDDATSLQYSNQCVAD